MDDDEKGDRRKWVAIVRRRSLGPSHPSSRWLVDIAAPAVGASSVLPEMEAPTHG
jgi:hypothetical protein